jgi:murein DD-endopeptidase MepM/ murein hydrolase activator NlpD
MPFRLVPLAAGVLLAAFPAPAIAQSGGAAAPDSGGGHVFEQPSPKQPAKTTAPRLRATIFTVSAGSVELGDPLRFTWRVDGPVRTVTARVTLVPDGGGKAISIALGKRRAGTRSLRTWTPREGRVPAGRYSARLQASGPRRARLRRTARASGRLALTVTAPAPPPAPAPVPAPAPALLSGTFPVQGAYSFGGAGARFGAGRTGHTHQGQDVVAAEGTPVVTPVAGIVFWRAYQAGGAGYYVVIHGDDGRDYAFMHFQQGSTLVAKGQRVAAGQQIASVGNTGDSQGAHLHFEIWPDGWYATADSHPIDPLPQLLLWAGIAAP